MLSPAEQQQIGGRPPQLGDVALKSTGRLCLGDWDAERLCGCQEGLPWAGLCVRPSRTRHCEYDGVFHGVKGVRRTTPARTWDRDGWSRVTPRPPRVCFHVLGHPPILRGASPRRPGTGPPFRNGAATPP